LDSQENKNQKIGWPNRQLDEWLAKKGRKNRLRKKKRVEGRRAGRRVSKNATSRKNNTGQRK